MQIEVTAINSVYSADNADIDIQQFFKDKQIIGRFFESDDELDEAIDKLERDHNITIESFSMVEHKTEEEHQEEWDDMLSSAMDESEDSGRSFDHIMGERLAGMY